jgi:hypothetical protein
MRRTLALLWIPFVCACAYYNGLYNARGLVRRAESAAREGRDSAALAAWRDAAAKADTVIARYPRSRWTDDALLVSGTASALSGDCSHGLARLVQWESHPGADVRHQARASIARGACLVRQGESARALDTLAAFVPHRDGAVARLAAPWAARAALATGRADSAANFARVAASDALDAELATAAIASGRAELAARLLRQRASEWRSLTRISAALDALARSQRAAADSIVDLAQQSRASRVDRARLSIAAGAWSERAGDMGRARRYYDNALEMAADTTVVVDATTRIALLDVRNAATVEEARALLDASHGRGTVTAVLAPVDTALRLATRLAESTDTSGASQFLAAEVVRDRVGAHPLARTLFLGVAREHPNSPLAPKALLAAAELSADSARAWRSIVRASYAASPYAHLLDGKPVSRESLEADERLLQQAWSRAMAGSDSPSVAADRRRP